MIDITNVITAIEMDNKVKIPYEQLLNKKGRARLPDKLMDHLDDGGLEDVIWWLPDGKSFAMDSKTVQEQILDVHFRGTKLASFIRSLNRWYANISCAVCCISVVLLTFNMCTFLCRGFRRVFFHAMPRNAICFQCPKFRRGERDLLKDMKLAPSGSGGTSKPSYVPDLGLTAAAGSISATVASSSQVDALFGRDIDLHRRGVSIASRAASLPAASIAGTSGMLESTNQSMKSQFHISQEGPTQISFLSLLALSSLQNTGSVLGQAVAGLPAARPLNIAANANQFQYPGVVNSASHGRDQALLAMMHREELLCQLQLQQHLQQQQQQTREMQYVQSLFPQGASRVAASLPPGMRQDGQFSPPLGHGISNPAAGLYAAAVASLRRPSEAKQEHDPPGGRAAADAALAEYLRRQDHGR
jgi:HSF-type DNA-binding